MVESSPGDQLVDNYTEIACTIEGVGLRPHLECCFSPLVVALFCTPLDLIACGAELDHRATNLLSGNNLVTRVKTSAG